MGAVGDTIKEVQQQIPNQFLRASEYRLTAPAGYPETASLEVWAGSLPIRTYYA